MTDQNDHSAFDHATIQILEGKMMAVSDGSRHSDYDAGDQAVPAEWSDTVEAGNTLGETVAQAAAQWGDKAFLNCRGSITTFAEFDHLVDQVAHSLADWGVGHGDAVAIMVSNRLEFLTSWFGSSRIGAVEVSINTAFKGEILRYVLDHSDARVIVCENEFLEQLIPHLSSLESLTDVLVVDADNSGVTLPPNVRMRTFAEVRENQRGNTSTTDVSPLDLAQIAYTSGTTGRSKGVMVQHNRIVQTGRSLARVRGVTSSDILYTCLPLFHGNAKYLTVMPALLTGACVALGARFSASNFWNEIRDYSATQFNYLGVMIASLNKQPIGDEDTQHPASLGWGAGAPREITEEFESRFGVTLIEGYGLTEAGIPLSNARTDRRVGSCGKPVEGYDVAVVDSWDNPVPIGEVGEIVIRSNKPYTTMKGYYKMPTETLEVFRNLWIHTGDLARKDDDDFFYFVDRSKDAIRRRGENISSQEIEAAVDTHPAVLESAAFAIPSELTEDDVMISVVLKKDAELTMDALHEHCQASMPYFWVPRYFRISHEPLPRTPTNKIEKHKLRDAGVDGDVWDREAGQGVRNR